MSDNHRARLWLCTGVLREEQDGDDGEEGEGTIKAGTDQAIGATQHAPHRMRSFSNGQEASEAAAIFRQVTPSVYHTNGNLGCSNDGFDL